MATRDTARLDQIRNLMQVAYVTTDMEQALAIFRNDYGISKVYDTGVVDFVPAVGRPVKVRVAMAYVGDMMFEAIQPLADGERLYSASLPTDGRFALRFHHLAFEAKSRDDLEALRKELAANNHPIVYGGEFGDGAFFYADARRDLGHYCEYVYQPAEFKARIPRN